MAKSNKIYKNGAWKKILRPFFNDNGTWKKCLIWQNVGGVWKRTTPIPYYSVNDNDADGAGANIDFGYNFLPQTNGIEFEVWFKSLNTTSKPGFYINCYNNSEKKGWGISVNGFSGGEAIISGGNGTYKQVSSANNIFTQVNKIYKIKGSILANGTAQVSYLNSSNEWETIINDTIPTSNPTTERCKFANNLRFLRSNTYYIRIKGTCNGVLKECVYDFCKDIGTKNVTDRFGSGINGTILNADADDVIRYE